MTSLTRPLTKTFFGLFILICVIFPGVFALGASPAKVVIDYNGYVDEDITFQVKSNSKYPAIIGVNYTGQPLEEYISYEPKEVTIQPGASGTFKVNIKIPENSEYVGKQSLWIRFFEKEILRGDDQESFINVATAAAPKIEVNFPYPGKYLEIHSASADNINEDENTTFKWKVVNRGEQDVHFSANLDVLDKNGTEMLTESFPLTLIAEGGTISKGRKLITDDLLTDKYDTVFTIYYDDVEKDLRSYFKVGTEDVDLIDYKPKVLFAGEINSFKLIVENLWNSQFTNVYGVIRINSLTIATPTSPLKALSNVELKQFLDLTGFEPGIYDGEVDIHFDENVKTFPLTINVTEKTVEKVDESTTFSFVTVLIIIGTLLFIGLLVMLVMLLFKQRKKK